VRGRKGDPEKRRAQFWRRAAGHRDSNLAGRGIGRAAEARHCGCGDLICREDLRGMGIGGAGGGTMVCACAEGAERGHG
jgi:hypothetical protein